MPVVGFLNSTSLDGYRPMLNAFRQGVQESGYIEGRNVAIEYRWAEGRNDRVVAGKACSRQPFVEEVATATLRCLRRHVPAAVPGIVFLSGGQNARLATVHLNATNRLPGPKPWKISFSNGRALQDPALEAWHGHDENLAAGQTALHRRASCNGAASVGKYTEEMELESASADDAPHRRDWRDD
jgi:Fructose-bisphosphate aldolase class-I